MNRYRGNDWVKTGFYWSPSRWEIITVPRGGGYLPGEADSRYLRLPVLFVVPLGLLIGALYVVFLPLIGFVLFFGFAGKRCFAVVWKAVARAARRAWPLYNENG